MAPSTTPGHEKPLDPRLLLFLDSRSPAGAHSHSGGMEAAVMSGWVSDIGDVEVFCRGRLRTSGRVAAAFAAEAARRWPTDLDDLDAEYSARTPSEASRTASRALGRGLLRLLAATAPHAAVDALRGKHHPLVLGAGCAILGGTPELAGHAAALGILTSAGSAAVRLLGLDPYAVHALLARLAADLDVPPGLPADSAPALDLLADVHARSEVRLFAS